MELRRRKIKGKRGKAFTRFQRSGKENIFEDSELEALLAEDSCQAQEELSASLAVTP